jgi:hypothetical protein
MSDHISEIDGFQAPVWSDVVRVVFSHVLMVFEELLFSHVDVILPPMQKPAYLLLFEVQPMVFVDALQELLNEGSMALLKSLLDPLHPDPIHTAFLPPRQILRFLLSNYHLSFHFILLALFLLWLLKSISSFLQDFLKFNCFDLEHFIDCKLRKVD